MTGSQRFGISDKDYVIEEVNCAGTESELLECIHSPFGQHSCQKASVPDIVIICNGTTFTLSRFKP